MRATRKAAATAVFLRFASQGTTADAGDAPAPCRQRQGVTGEIREAEIFVAVLAASNLTYAEATWTQQLPDWIGAYVRMFS